MVIADIQSFPIYRDLELGSMPVPEMFSFCKNAQLGLPMANPEDDLLLFYLASQVIGEARSRFGEYTPLPKKWEAAVSYLVKQQNEIALRVFVYLFFIVLREARHCRDMYDKTESLSPNKDIQKYLREIAGHSSEYVFSAIVQQKWNSSIEELIAAITWVFHYGTFDAGYGGKKWEEVARVLLNVLSGNMTFELMADDAFALSHNNGPIFNKGYVYLMYQEYFVVLLDIQRAGQLVNFIYDWDNDRRYFSEGLSNIVYDLVSTLSPLYQELQAEPLDFYTIEETAVSDLYSLIEKQKQFGISKKSGSKKKTVAATVFSIPGIVSAPVVNRIQLLLGEANG